MESKLMDLVKAMHEKFGLENTKGVLHLTKEEKEFRSAAMLEELNEYIAADTLVDQYDALLDLIVFAVGTLERHGFPLLAGFEKVMEANMAKEVGQNGEKRGGFKRDLVKPEGWTAPEAKLQLILDSKSNTQVVFDFAPSSDGNLVAGFAPKFDATKVRVDLLPIEPMMQIATVFGFGAKKFFAKSYRQGETVVWSRTYGSIMRHMMAFWSGEDKDPESGLSHLAHAACCIMFLLEFEKTHKELDDRYKT